MQQLTILIPVLSAPLTSLEEFSWRRPHQRNHIRQMASVIQCKVTVVVNPEKTFLLHQVPHLDSRLSV
jgi:hypothetical protein